MFSRKIKIEKFLKLHNFSINEIIRRKIKYTYTFDFGILLLIEI